MLRHVAAALAALAIWLGPTSTGAATCERLVDEGHAYTVCKVDLAREHLGLFNRDAAGHPFATFDRLAASLAASHRTLVFAANAGMYHLDLSPVGLFIANGDTSNPASTAEGFGNFFLKPNGVFFFGGDRAGIEETAAFLAANRHPAFATQSGPMLVIAGRLHPSLQPGGTSLKVRNGVGVRDGGRTAVFALSEEPVSFFRFAVLFRDGLGCPDALFLDGSVSAIYAPALHRNSQVWPLGPMVGVSVPAP